VIAVLGFAVISAACSGGSRDCTPISLAAAVEPQLSEARALLDFDPIPPCRFRDGITVRRVFVDRLPGDPPIPRINFSVARGDERVLTLSETRAPLPFRAIPQGTHALRVPTDGLVASGFAGPSGNGDELAYLRWRSGGITYELAGTLGVWLTESDMRALAQALMRRSVGLSVGEPG